MLQAQSGQIGVRIQPSPSSRSLGCNCRRAVRSAHIALWRGGGWGTAWPDLAGYALSGVFTHRQPAATSRRMHFDRRGTLADAGVGRVHGGARGAFSTTSSTACGRSARSRRGVCQRTSVGNSAGNTLPDVTEPIVDLFAAETERAVGVDKLYLLGAEAGSVCRRWCSQRINARNPKLRMLDAVPGA
jgi:hypothetical protein